MKSVLFFFFLFDPQKGERDEADARRCLTSRVDGGSGGRSLSEYTYSTVTTVFPASSETIENVLSDRKCVCVTGSTPSLALEKKQKNKPKPRAAESALRKTARDVGDGGRGRKHRYSNSTD